MTYVLGFIFKYSLETLPRKWVKKIVSSNLGIDLIPLQTIYFSCCAFWNCIPIWGFKFWLIFVEQWVLLFKKKREWKINNSQVVLLWITKCCPLFPCEISNEHIFGHCLSRCELFNSTLDQYVRGLG